MSTGEWVGGENEPSSSNRRHIQGERDTSVQSVYRWVGVGGNRLSSSNRRHNQGERERVVQVFKVSTGEWMWVRIDLSPSNLRYT